MFEIRSQRGEQVKYPLIDIKLHLVLLSIVSEKLTSGKPCFDLKMKRKISLIVAL
jgi:hypothetical protein